MASLGALSRSAPSSGDVIDRPAERERDGEHPGILISKDGARGRDTDIRRNDDIAVAAHQHHRLVSEPCSQGLTELAVTDQHFGRTEAVTAFPDRNADVQE